MVGGLDETLKCLEDYDFALRIAQKYKAIFINEIYLDATYSISGVSGGDTGQYLIAKAPFTCKIQGRLSCNRYF